MTRESPASDPYFFGYGSLVNRATHAYPAAQPAQLAGYRRVWRATHLRQLAFLSVEPAVGTTIDGLIATVPGADWQALDDREAAYARRVVTAQVTAANRPDDIWVYAVSAPVLDAPAGDHPILRSYLDTVLQGFLQEFGPTGATRFMETTTGWQHPIQDDRAAPIYPRTQALSEEEAALIEDLITQL